MASSSSKDFGAMIGVGGLTQGKNKFNTKYGYK